MRIMQIARRIFAPMAVGVIGCMVTMPLEKRSIKADSLAEILDTAKDAHGCIGHGESALGQSAAESLARLNYLDRCGTEKISICEVHQLPPATTVVIACSSGNIQQ